MARFNDLGHGKLEGRKLDPREIVIRRDFNYREMDSEHVKAHIEWLKQNIREQGVQEPVRVEYKAGVAYLVNGHCRVEACKQLFKEGERVPYKDGGYGPPLVPAIVVEGDEAQLLAASMVANSSLPPTILEFGAAARRLVNLGWDPEAVARYVPASIAGDGKKALKFVKDALELNAAPLDVKKAVREGVNGVKVSPALAVAAVRSNPLNPGQVIAAEATKALAKGKSEAKRPKGPGKAAAAKEAVEKKHRSLEKIGDAMAEEIMSTPWDEEKLEKLANEWLAARKG